MDCDLCRLHKHATNVCIGGDGEPGGLMIVGEAPGSDEDRLGQCFVGPTGQILRAFVRKILPNSKVYYTNAVRCFPNKGDPRKYLAKCRDHLLRDIEQVKPKRIIAFGSIAIESLVGEQLPVTQIAGGWTRSTPYVSKLIQFMLHPAARLHNKALIGYWEKETKRVLTTIPSHTWRAFPQTDVIQINDINKAAAVIKGLTKYPLVSYDTEYNNKTNRVLCVAFSASVNKAYVFPDTVLSSGKVLSAIEGLFYNGNIVAHNWKFDAWVSVRGLGIDIDSIINSKKGWWLDTSTLRKLYHPEQESNLDISAWMVGMGGHKGPLQDKLTGKTGPAYEKAYNNYPDLVMEYCGYDAIACLRLAYLYQSLMQHDRLWPLWEETFGPLGGALFGLENAGIRVDIEALDALSARLQHLMAIELTAIRESPVVKRLCKGWDKDIPSSEFNPKSTPQMRALLYSQDGFGIDTANTPKTPKGAPKVDRHIIADTKNDPVMGHIAEYNRLAHKQSTYVDGYRKRLYPDDRLRTTYRQDTARTQRLSSQNPNLW